MVFWNSRTGNTSPVWHLSVRLAFHQHYFGSFIYSVTVPGPVSLLLSASERFVLWLAPEETKPLAKSLFLLFNIKS